MTKDALSGAISKSYSYGDGKNDEMSGWTCYCSKICAVLYWDKNYKGDQLPIPEGSHSNIKNTAYNKWNDKISSIKVRSGCRLKAYENDSWEKYMWEETGSWNGSGYGNDKITGWKCSC